jgi:hypothetical protein
MTHHTHRQIPSRSYLHATRIRHLAQNDKSSRGAWHGLVDRTAEQRRGRTHLKVYPYDPGPYAGIISAALRSSMAATFRSSQVSHSATPRSFPMSTEPPPMTG